MGARSNGLLGALAAYGLWGILPLYWKLVDRVDAYSILASRIIWSFVFTIFLIIVIRQFTAFKAGLRDWRLLAKIAGASILVAFNWGLYISAVNADRIVDASLGYYINPLLAVILGVVVFKERLNRCQLLGIFLAGAGVVLKTFNYGQVPWISLGLAGSFAIYGAIKKSIRINSLISLTLETALLSPVALLFLGLQELGGNGAYGNSSLGIIVLLAGAGIITALPLLLFGYAAKQLPLSLLGLTQYLSPTISLLLGTLVYHEDFGMVDLTAFAIIWVALGIFTYGQFKKPVEAKSQDIVAE
ncbi:MAG: EamA family transporter RarD [Erysipelotrichaceae bacterium]|nr:EamA family transporter RarD [Erysipelotrichaceae bacterium]